MKKLLYLSLLSTLIFSTSCSHTIYNTRELQGNYDIRMDSKNELEIKSKVRIFLSDNDIKGEYIVIAHNTYNPFCFPLFMSKKKEIKKKFYENAVKQAYKLGGNGVVITGVDSYKVISIYQWDSDNEETVGYTNLIFDTSLLDIFNEGKVTTASPREIKRFVNDMKIEIQLNIKSVKTSEEVNIIERKLESLQTYNNSLAKPEKSLNKFFTKNRTELIKKAKKIFKKENKILNTLLLNNFKTNKISQLPPTQADACVKEFVSEIQSNISSAKTTDDISIISEKISVLQTWYNSQSKQDKNLNKTIINLNEKCAKQSKKISKKEANK